MILLQTIIINIDVSVWYPKRVLTEKRKLWTAEFKSYVWFDEDGVREIN